MEPRGSRSGCFQSLEDTAIWPPTLGANMFALGTGLSLRSGRKLHSLLSDHIELR